MLDSLKRRAQQLKTETYALYLAGRHPDTPWHAKILVLVVVAYALSPIDLIPDFVPVLGYLDDLLLVPLGIALAIRMIPPEVMKECRARAQNAASNPRKASYAAAAVILIIWVTLATLCIRWFLARLRRTDAGLCW